MTLSEQIQTFGKEATEDAIQSIILDHQYHLSLIETENEFIFQDYLKNSEPSIDWVFNYRMAQNKEAERKLRKLIRKWEVKLKIARGELDESKVLIDLDVIKQVQITQFLGEPSMRGSKKLHYKAPWRPEEKQGSLVIFTDQNRFYDFGDHDKKGSVIDFIMLTEGLEFKEAVNYLKNYL
jgi:hypothetical protein